MDSSFASITSLKDVTLRHDSTSPQDFTSPEAHESSLFQDLSGSWSVMIDAPDRITHHDGPYVSPSHVLSCKGYLQDAYTSAWSIPTWYCTEESHETVAKCCDGTYSSTVLSSTDNGQQSSSVLKPVTPSTKVLDKLHSVETVRGDGSRESTYFTLLTKKGPTEIVHTPCTVETPHTSAVAKESIPFSNADKLGCSPIAKKFSLLPDSTPSSLHRECRFHGPLEYLAHPATDEQMAVLRKEVQKDLDLIKLQLGIQDAPVKIAASRDIPFMTRKVAKANELNNDMAFTVFMLAVLFSLYLFIEG